jgi:hypothetical protein
MTKIIEFSLLETFSGIEHMPIPAKKSMPTWLKDLPGDVKGVPTLKKCPPLLDTFGFGYIVPTWQEFELIPHEGLYHFKSGIAHIVSPYEQIRPICSYQFPEQYKNTPFDQYQIIKLQSPWVIKTPPGYSLLVMPLINTTNELPFEVIPAVIDADVYHVNFGFTCKIKFDPNKSYNIQPGIPLAQLIPIKRDKWKMTTTETSLLAHAKIKNRLRTFIMSGYRKLFWQKKDYD